MRAKKIKAAIIIFAGCILLLVLALYEQMDVGINDAYSSWQVSDSIEEARRNKIFVFQPELENKIIEDCAN